jgi:hypothetical protein
MANPRSTNEPTSANSPIDDVNRSVTLNGNVTPVKSIAFDGSGAGANEIPSYPFEMFIYLANC